MANLHAFGLQLDSKLRLVIHVLSRTRAVADPFRLSSYYEEFCFLYKEDGSRPGVAITLILVSSQVFTVGGLAL